MKTGIHPEYMVAKVTCACGRVTETRATVPELHVDICSHCHPFFTGRQKLVDTAGRVERFRAKYGNGESAPSEDRPEADEAPAAEAEAEAVNVAVEAEAESVAPEEAVEAEVAVDAVVEASADSDAEAESFEPTQPAQPEEDKPATE